MKSILPGLSRVSDQRSVYARRYIIAVTVTLATMLETLDATIVSVAVPNMMGNLGATLDEIAWVTTGYALANVIVLPISGWLGDWFGRRNYFCLSLLGFTLASVMCSLSTSVESLVVWRMLQGLAGGGLISTSQVILLESFPPLEVGIGMAIWSVGIMVGPAIGPPLGGWLTETLSWPWIFYVNLPFGLVALVLALMYVPDSRFAKKLERVDGLGLLLLAAGLGCTQALLERGERLDWFASREIVAYAVIAPVSLALLVWHELRCPHPIINMRVFTDRQFLAAAVCIMCWGFCFTYVFAFPVLMQTVHGYTAAQAGWAIMPYVIATTVGFGCVGKLMSYPRLDTRPIIAAGIGIIGLGFWYHSTLTGATSWQDLLWPEIVIGLGTAMLILPTTTLATASLRPEMVAAGNGLFNVARMVSGSFAIALFTTLLSQRYDIARGELMRQINSASEATVERLALFREFLIGHGTSLALVPRKALKLLDLEISLQAQVIAFNQTMAIFAMVVLAFLIAVPLLPIGRAGKAESGSVH